MNISLGIIIGVSLGLVAGDYFKVPCPTCVQEVQDLSACYQELSFMSSQNICIADYIACLQNENKLTDTCAQGAVDCVGPAEVK